MERLRTGSAELDAILGGGLPAGSLVILAGAPGTGKTILAQQACFANATPEHPAIYYTTQSEPHSKLIRHLDSFRFFDRESLGTRVEFQHLALLSGRGSQIEAVAHEVVRKAFEAQPCVVVIDSSRALHQVVPEGELRQVVYDMASRVGHTDAVLVLVGEYGDEDVERAPEFAVADVIIWLANEGEAEFDRRWLRVLKVRGSDYLAGRHPFRIAEEGVAVLPRLEAAPPPSAVVGEGRLSTGIEALDDMTRGGLPARSVTLVAGPSGSGKTVLSLQFLVSGLARGESGIFLSLQESAEQLVSKARAFGWDLEPPLASGLFRILHVQPVEMGLDALASAVRSALGAAPATRVVVEGMAELEHAARGSGRLPDYMWSFLGMLRAAGATTVITSETTAFFGPSFELARGLSFIMDNAILLRYTELESEIRRALAVVKMRDSDHVKSLVEFEIGGRGVEIKQKFAGVAGVLTGVPVRTEERFREFFGR